MGGLGVPGAVWPVGCVCVWREWERMCVSEGVRDREAWRSLHPGLSCCRRLPFSVLFLVLIKLHSSILRFAKVWGENGRWRPLPLSWAMGSACCVAAQGPFLLGPRLESSPRSPWGCTCGAHAPPRRFLCRHMCCAPTAASHSSLHAHVPSRAHLTERGLAVLWRVGVYLRLSVRDSVSVPLWV